MRSFNLYAISFYNIDKQLDWTDPTGFLQPAQRAPIRAYSAGEASSIFRFVYCEFFL